MAQGKNKAFLMMSIREELLKNGFTMASWARKYRYIEADVVKTINRYAAKQQMPRSPKVFAMLNRLYKDTGVNLIRKAQ